MAAASSCLLNQSYELLLSERDEWIDIEVEFMLMVQQIGPRATVAHSSPLHVVNASERVKRAFIDHFGSVATE
jgi:hypothetical protein